MKEKDELTHLFKSQLTEAEMPVRSGFWEALDAELSELPKVAESPERARTVFMHSYWWAVASVSLLLGMASAAFWHFSPRTGIRQAFNQVATLTPDASAEGDAIIQDMPDRQSPLSTLPASNSRWAASTSSRSASAGTQLDHTDPNQAYLATLTKEPRKEETVQVRVSITIREQNYGTPDNYNRGHAQKTSTYPMQGELPDAASPLLQEEHEKESASSGRPNRWALKAALGTSLPKGDCASPFTAQLSAEVPLNKRFSMEAGLQYQCLPMKGVADNLHALALPVKLHALLVSTSKFDFYATLGGAVEKYVAGASDNSFSAEPLQLSAMAGLGVSYRMTDRLALFAEPSVSHHFDTDAQSYSLRNARPTNLNLLCGVRMSY